MLKINHYFWNLTTLVYFISQVALYKIENNQKTTCKVLYFLN